VVEFNLYGHRDTVADLSDVGITMVMGCRVSLYRNTFSQAPFELIKTRHLKCRNLKLPLIKSVLAKLSTDMCLKSCQIQRRLGGYVVFNYTQISLGKATHVIRSLIRLIRECDFDEQGRRYTRTATATKAN